LALLVVVGDSNDFHSVVKPLFGDIDMCASPVFAYIFFDDFMTIYFELIHI